MSDTQERLREFRSKCEKMEAKRLDSPNEYGPVMIWPDLALSLLDIAEAAREVVYDTDNRLGGLRNQQRLKDALASLDAAEDKP